jgi:hypothetical protein
MLKLQPESQCGVQADSLPAPAAPLPPQSPGPVDLPVETDLSTDRPVTDAEIDAICRLLGEDLLRLLDETRRH